MTGEEPIFTVSHTLPARVVGLVALAFFGFVVWAGLRGATVEILQAMGWWVAPILVLGGFQLLRLVRHIAFSDSELRFFTDRVIVIGGGRKSVHSYHDVSGFVVTDSGVSVQFRNGASIGLSPGDGHDAMDLIQQYVGRELPGYRKQHLSIAGS